MVAQLIKTKKTTVFITKIWQNCVESVATWQGRKKYEVKKYTDSIESHFYSNINIDNNALHPEYVSKMLFINEQFNETKHYHQAYTI